MGRIFLMCAVLVGFPGLSSYCQTSTEAQVPKIIDSGFDAYKATGPDDAIKAWLKGSPIEGSKDAMSQANVLRTVQEYYGAYRSWDFVSTRNLTPSTRILYLVIDYEKGPLFGKFVIYHADPGWIVTSFTFNTNEASVFPSASVP